MISKRQSTNWTLAFPLVWLTVVTLLMAPGKSVAQGSTAKPAEPVGFKNGNYRSVTPETLSGAHVLTTKTARALWQTRTAIFIDVLPRRSRPAQLPQGTIFRIPKRMNIPGSVWLPNVGFGVIPPNVDAYFRANLHTLRGGDKTKPLVIYCLENCWMSWNAAKRALRYGYGNIYWYPEGTDGWVREDGPLELSSPVPLKTD